MGDTSFKRRLQGVSGKYSNVESFAFQKPPTALLVKTDKGRTQNVYRKCKYPGTRRNLGIGMSSGNSGPWLNSESIGLLWRVYSEGGRRGKMSRPNLGERPKQDLDASGIKRLFEF